MPNMNREKYATASKTLGVWYWHARPNEAKPFDDMDIDYLANCLRLVYRRRLDLMQAVPYREERGEAIELLLEEDSEIIEALINELNSRNDVGEHEDE